MQIVCIHIQIFMRTNPFYLLCEQYFISIYARDAATLALLLACSTQNFTTLVILFTVFFLFLSSSCSGRRCDATAKIYLIVFGFERDSWKSMLRRTLCNWSCRKLYTNVGHSVRRCGHKIHISWHTEMGSRRSSTERKTQRANNADFMYF